jgi:glycosyltransferase involved in cell wall biosynthesis
MGGALKEVVWSDRAGSCVEKGARRPFQPDVSDWLLTPELFSEQERPGFGGWLKSHPCRLAALYHDSIPMRFPEFTWPHSVARHPHYLKLLARFDVVFANSVFRASELADYWQWLGVEGAQPVSIPLGADGLGANRASLDPRHSSRKSIVMVGIVETRKNQTAVLDAAEKLWSDGEEFSLSFAGRVNPHFGKPIDRRMKSLSRSGRPLEHLEKASDRDVSQLLAGARFALMPSLAEGCGLPVLESLWCGVPVICSDIAPLRESANGGGCVVVSADAPGDLESAMRRLLVDDSAISEMAKSVVSRPLPTWSDTADTILKTLG